MRRARTPLSPRGRGVGGEGIIRRYLTLFAVAILALAGCGPAAGQSAVPASPPASTSTSGTLAPATMFPVTITDDAGRQVRLERQPQRIVSAAPSNTEILFALGVADRVAAVTNFCDYPEAATLKPKIGGLRPNLEAIVAQQPDLVLAVRGFPADALAVLEGQQIPVAILNPADFAGVLANIRTVGQLTGATATAQRVTEEMQGRWNAVAEKGKTAASRPRVFFEVDATDPAAVSAAGPGTFMDAMITAAGGVNVLATLTPGQQYPKISAEALLQADPQLIILGDSAFGQSAETVARRPGWAAVEAVRQGAIVEMPEPNIVSRPGPRLVDGLEAVARAIHPELFGAPR